MKWWMKLIGLEEPKEHYHQGIFDKYPRKVTEEEVELHNVGKLLPLVIFLCILKSLRDMCKRVMRFLGSGEKDDS